MWSSRARKSLTKGCWVPRSLFSVLNSASENSGLGLGVANQDVINIKVGGASHRKCSRCNGAQSLLCNPYLLLQMRHRRSVFCSAPILQFFKIRLSNFELLSILIQMQCSNFASLLAIFIIY